MSKAKKIFIRTESRQLLIVRTAGGRAFRAFCETCGADAEFLTLDEAIGLSGRPMKTLVRLLEAGELHSIETGDGRWLVCRASLKTKEREIISSPEKQIDKA